MSANFCFASAKVQKYFELSKKSYKKSPFMLGNINGDKKTYKLYLLFVLHFCRFCPTTR